jgi:hypothetical protein
MDQDRHCEEQSDEAIHFFVGAMDCFAPLTMTKTGGSRVANVGPFDDDAARQERRFPGRLSKNA